MSDNNSESSKKLSVTLDKNISSVPTYELFLLRGSSDYMEIQLARKTETESEVNIHVEHVFRITKSAVPHFTRQFMKYLQEAFGKQESQGQPDD